MSTHAAIAATKLGHIDAIQVPTPTPGDGQVLIKVEYSSMIPFDTYITDLGYHVQGWPTILGFNASGTVAKIGSGVSDLKVGDNVTAATFIRPDAKGMQEYTLQPRFVVAKVPPNVTLEGAVTIPDNFITAYYTLFNQLSLPVPASFPAESAPPLADKPILVYGAGSTAGQFAIQLLHAAGYKRILATASTKHHDFLRSLGATDLFDYRSSTLAQDIATAVGGDGKVSIALDAIANEDTIKKIAGVISEEGTAAILSPIKKGEALTVDDISKFTSELNEKDSPFPKGTKTVIVRTFLYLLDPSSHKVIPEILPSLLEQGIIQPNRVKLLDQGSFLDRVRVGLDLLRNNKISGEKVVVKVTA